MLVDQATALTRPVIVRNVLVLPSDASENDAVYLIDKHGDHIPGFYVFRQNEWQLSNYVNPIRER